MPDTNRPRLKVSRAGIVLIKSFESFRPRAVRRDDDRWVIGYGHTASAREGLTVGEQDAELLLQYDLMPVVKALNDQVETELNQHQFDALASFAVSVGVDRFLSSDVLKRLNDGHTGEAADALVGWPEALSPDAALRRRAAERALFVADPAAPVLLADLLAAPLPPPPVAVVEPEAEPASTLNLSRAAAVASLLGEAHQAETEPDPEVEVEPEPQPAEPEPAADPIEEPAEEPVIETEVVAEPQPAPAAPRPLPSPSVWTPQPQSWSPALPPAEAAHLQRYSPYGGSVIGPLPGFPVYAEPEPEPEPEEPAVAQEAPVEPEAPVEAPAEVPVEAVEPSVETVEIPAEPIAEPMPQAPVEAFDTPVETPVFAPVTPLVSPSAGPSPFPPLELTPATESDFAEPARAAWTPEERPAPTEAEETVLFEEEPPLAVLRHEVEAAPTRRFDWIETGPYMIMGGLGLFSCAASAAAFRKATSDPLPTNEFTVIAWVLALIGVLCVGVSAWNLYTRTVRRD